MSETTPPPTGDRTRRRARRPAGTPAVAPAARVRREPPKTEPPKTEPHKTEPISTEPPKPRRADRTDRTDRTERQWRELAGAAHSQLSLSAALRARDADRPSAAEQAEAEAGVVIQRRNWRPSA